MAAVPLGGVDLAEIPLLSTRAELAKLLRVEIRTVDRLVSEGRLRVTKLAQGKSGRCVFLRAEIERFLLEAAQ
jgi:excisionase family DNA binding protein